MSDILTSKKCLVLNKNWTPVGTVTLHRAIIMLFSEYGDGTPKARIIEPDTYQTFTWSDWGKLQLLATDEKIAAANMAFKIPEIILLSKYEKLPKPKVHFSRRTLLKRDKQCCQYCGKHCDPDEWTMDHIQPRSRGGMTTWENVVIACVGCNRRKADRTPTEAGMALRSVPKKPQMSLFRYDMSKPVKSWAAFLGEAYMNVEIENNM